MKEPNQKERNVLGGKEALAAAVSAAVASTAGAQSSQLAIEEVVVTASKRESNLQDLPQSIQAFTTDDIAKRGFSGIDDYAKQIPSMSFARREPGGTSVIFRGVASSGIQFGTNPTAAVYIDEQAVTAAGANPNPRMIDMERIEALSGPQGTLFGEASQSGTLRLITNKPNTEEFASWVDTRVGYVDGGEAEGEISAMFNAPVSENMAFRFVGYRAEDAGFVDNVMGYSQGTDRFDNGHIVEENVNSSSSWGGRAALRYQTDNWTTDLTYVAENSKVNGFTDVNEYYTMADGSEGMLGDLQQVRFNPESSRDKWQQIGLTVTGDLGFADLTVAVSHFDREFSYEADATDYVFEFQKTGDEWRAYAAYNPYYNVYGIYDFGGDVDAVATQVQDMTNDSIEVRLASPGDSDSRWNWVVGAFYSKKQNQSQFDSNINSNFSNNPYDADFVPGAAYLNYANYYEHGEWLNFKSDNWFTGTYDLEVEHKAVFGEISVDLTERLNLTAGGRWFEETREFYLLQGGYRLNDSLESGNHTTGYIGLDERTKRAHDGFVPRVSANYAITDDVMGYVTYAEGFRPGGSSPVKTRSMLPSTFESDLLKSTEVGLKMTLLDNRLRWNMAAYTMKWDDIQVQVSSPVTFGLAITNLESAKIDGFETDLLFVPAERWELSLNYAYNDAATDSNSIVYGVDENGVEDKTVELVNLGPGVRLPITPDHKFSMGAEYSFANQAFCADQYIRADVSYVGESVNALEGGEAVNYGSVRTQPDYATLDLRYGLDSDKWSMSVALNNATDERATQFINNRWGSRQRISINKPRNVSLNFKYHF